MPLQDSKIGSRKISLGRGFQLEPIIYLSNLGRILVGKAEFGGDFYLLLIPTLFSSSNEKMPRKQCSKLLRT